MAGESSKGKGVMEIAAVSISEEAEIATRKEDISAAPVASYSRMPSRNASSKYDFVKVKVWLGDNADHYYVLSRFLLCRMLTVTKIPNHIAIKIALELKKLLIDNSLLDVSQSDLEANLFKLMERRGFGKEYIDRYKMMTKFHHQRVPLVILVCGTACTGKSTIATQLAQRLNLPNVLQTDMVYELLRTSTDAPLASVPVWARKFSSPEELITEFCRECRIVWKGLAGDLKKAMKDGKPIIIEGVHLDPSIYLMNEENKGSLGLLLSKKGSDYSQNNPVTTPSMPKKQNKGDNEEDRILKIENAGRKDKPLSEPIVVPIVLKMADFDHKALLEEWISSRNIGDKCFSQDHDNLVTNLNTIQNYLSSFEAQGLMVANISATTFRQTLDWLHSYLLKCIEEGVSSASKEA